jgi:hypothetical protein
MPRAREAFTSQGLASKVIAPGLGQSRAKVAREWHEKDTRGLTDPCVRISQTSPQRFRRCKETASSRCASASSAAAHCRADAWPAARSSFTGATSTPGATTASRSAFTTRRRHRRSCAQRRAATASLRPSRSAETWPMCMPPELVRRSACAQSRAATRTAGAARARGRTVRAHAEQAA